MRTILDDVAMVEVVTTVGVDVWAKYWVAAAVLRIRWVVGAEGVSDRSLGTCGGVVGFERSGDLSGRGGGS